MPTRKSSSAPRRSGRFSFKVGLGKLTADPGEVLASLESAGFQSLPIAGEHAVRVARLPPLHRDPFDRLLVARALVEPMRPLTNDAALARYGGIITVVWRRRARLPPGLAVPCFPALPLV